MNQTQYEMKSSIGTLFLVASKQGLEGVFWDKQNIRVVKTLDPSKPEEKILLDAVNQLKEYFSGQRKQFDVALHFAGTVFQETVWRELYKIPFGTTVSYRDIAKRIKNPKAVRAVGSANGKNPICIIIPCHRVINANGSMGGYSSGVDIKRQLLALERK